MRKINLNLLLHLYALLTEKKVSTAAKRAYITQPAMSTSLKQLRAIFHDPLLVSVGREMELSAKGQSLLPKIQSIVQDIEVLVDLETTFEPENLVKIFNLGIPDYLQMLILPKLQQRLIAYPGIQINAVNYSTIDNPILFKDNFVDLAIGVCTKKKIPEQIMAEKLFDQKIICYGRNDNVHMRKPLTLEEYAKLNHVAFSFNKELYSPSALALKEQSMKRNDVIYVESFLSAIYTVANSSNLISTGPQFLIDIVKNQFNLCYQQLPYKIKATPVYIANHLGVASKKEIAWLKDMIIEIVSKDIIAKHAGVSK